MNRKVVSPNEPCIHRIDHLPWLRSTTLSFRAKGILAYLELSVRDESLAAQDLFDIGPDEPKEIKAALQELVSQHYVSVVQGPWPPELVIKPTLKGGAA